MSEQTIGALAKATGISRSTLLQAAQQRRVPARQSGAIWLVDTDAEAFKRWLRDHPNQARVKGKRKDDLVSD